MYKKYAHSIIGNEIVVLHRNRRILHFITDVHMNEIKRACSSAAVQCDY